jgi:hypothetical protein
LSCRLKLLIQELTAAKEASSAIKVKVAEHESGLQFHQTTQVTTVTSARLVGTHEHVQTTLELVKDILDAVKDEIAFAHDTYRVDLSPLAPEADLLSSEFICTRFRRFLIVVQSAVTEQELVMRWLNYHLSKSPIEVFTEKNAAFFVGFTTTSASVAAAPQSLTSPAMPGSTLSVPSGLGLGLIASPLSAALSAAGHSGFSFELASPGGSGSAAPDLLASPVPPAADSPDQSARVWELPTKK